MTADRYSPFNPPKNWRNCCRFLFLGYGPCYRNRGHSGGCMSLAGAGTTVRFRTRRVAVDSRGHLIKGDDWRVNCGYILERPNPRAALAEAKQSIREIDAEIRASKRMRAAYSGIVRARGKCDAMPKPEDYEA